MTRDDCERLRAELAGVREAFHDAVTQHRKTHELLTETYNELEELSAERDQLKHSQSAVDAKYDEARRNAELHNDAANAAELRIVELRATIARVEALPAKWLDDVAYQRESVAQCAIDVEVVLRGEEP